MEPPPLLCADGLTVRHGTTVALDDVSFVLTVGEMVALVGPNGSGKSTLLDVLARVRRPDAGRLRPADGCEVAYVVQHSAVPRSFPISVEQAVAIGCWGHLGTWRRYGAADRRRVAAMLERVGLADVAGRRLGSLSGGQRQRALVAQALVRSAPVLLLDEPTAGVDDAAGAVIRELMRDEARRGTGVVVATHDQRDVAVADRVVALEAGRLRVG